MKEVVTAVIAELSDGYKFASEGRITPIVLLTFCELEQETSAFSTSRFGVSSDELATVLTDLAKEDEIVMDARLTYGGNERRYFKLDESDCSEHVAATVQSVCMEYGDVPVSNLHKIAADEYNQF